MLLITMQDTIVSRYIDEEWSSALMTLNSAAQAGKAFAVMETPEGKHCMINIGKILTVDEVDE